MPMEKEVWDESYPANGDLSTKQWYGVELLSTGRVDVANAATDRAIGILQTKPALLGRAARIRHIGVSNAVSDGSGANIAIGDPVTVSATGKIVKNTTADRPLLGYALDASVADGTVIRVAMGLPGLAAFRTPA